MGSGEVGSVADLPADALQIAVEVGQISAAPGDIEVRASALLAPLRRLVQFQAACIQLIGDGQPRGLPLVSEGYDEATLGYIESPANVEEIEMLGFHRQRGLPVAVVFGVRAQPVRATLGLGLYALTVDEVNDDTGVGLYSPFACARVGGDVFGIQLGADARITRRWQIGAPDHTQWQIGVFAGGTWESKHRGPRY